MTNTLAYNDTELIMAVKMFYNTGLTQLGSNLTCKYQTMVRVTESDRHSSLQQIVINYSCKNVLLYRPHSGTFKPYLQILDYDVSD